MKNVISFFIIILLFGVCYFYRDNITDYIIDNIVAPKDTVVYKDNPYALKNSYHFLQINDDFFPKNKQDILNIIYTRLDQGLDEFYFYCDDDYPNCENDVKEITNNDILLSEINNFIHPYNSYDKLSITFDSFGKILIKTGKLYTEDQIVQVNELIDEFINNNVNPNSSDIDKIRVFHDYVINSTKYDQAKADAIKAGTDLTDSYNSQTAYGALIEHMAICGGYSDAMAIYLNKLGIQNYKVASDIHVWNVVKLDDYWYHLDLTWDDPVTSDGSDAIIDDFFLIDTNTLQTLNLEEHNFDKSVYVEAS